MTEARKKNVQAIIQGLDEMHRKYSELNKKVEHLEALNADLQNKYNVLQNQVFGLLARVQGTGATTE